MLASASRASAADAPTSLQLSWLSTCMSGTIQLSVNGTPVGSFDIQQGSPVCNCGDFERSVTLTDSGTLAAMDTKACNLYTATFTGTGGTRYLAYVRVTAQYSVSGTDSLCLVDTATPGQGCAPRNTCSGLATIADGASYGNTLPMANGTTPDCRVPTYDADGDGVPNSTDNCPFRFNPTQTDTDSDGVGDACDNCAAKANANQADADHDGYGDVCDNCVNVANPTQSDCNKNGVGDACEPLPANQDPDLDGVCTGIDNCPTIANADQSDENKNGIGDVCDLLAVPVPWISANPSLPHPTYSGYSATLKGIARNGATQYYWEYGDGSAPMPWTTISDPYNLGVKHAYTGSVGQTFYAVLHVGVGPLGAPTFEDNEVYPIQIGDYSTTYTTPTNAQLDVRINVAIDESLWYLHTHMQRGTFAAGAPGYGQPYALWTTNMAENCAAIDAFQLKGSRVNKDYTADPYVEDVQRAINNVLQYYTIQAITAQPAGNPDANNNGIGLYTPPSSNNTYVDGICGTTLASSSAPGFVAPVGNAGVKGRKLADIIQDIVDYWAWGQADSGTAEGGWQYSANSQSSDGSTAQWPVRLMTAAEGGMGSTIPGFVRTELKKWWTFSRSSAAGPDCGGWGYNNNSLWLNNAKTAAGVIEGNFMGLTLTDGNVKGGLGFIYRHWNQNDSSWNTNLGASYSMYGIMKAMRVWNPVITSISDYSCDGTTGGTNSFDWYYSPLSSGSEGIAVNLIRRQNADGSWNDLPASNNLNVYHSTAWDSLILQKGLDTIPPQALICDCANQNYGPNQDIKLSGACSTHPDLNRSIVGYDWDNRYDSTKGFRSQATGISETIVGGFSAVGTYPVALQVTDDNPAKLGGPQTNLAICNVTITAGAHCPHPDAGGGSLHSYNGFVGVPVQLDASASFSPDGTALTYNWSLSGNPSVFGSSTLAKPTWTYNAAGTYSIAVQVSDGTCTKTSYATVIVGNHAPIANPGGPYSGAPGQTLQLDGSGSYDPDPGDTITYAWDFQNNGAFGDSTLVKPSYTIPAGAAVGTVVSICLRVTDNSGARGTKCTTLSVVAIKPPGCVAGAAQSQSCSAGAVIFALDGTGSTDPQGRTLKYSWAAGTCAGGTVTLTNGSSAKPTASFNTGVLTACNDNCGVTLTVDNGTYTSSCNVNLTVTDPGPPVIACPAAVTLECTANSSANANPGTATATDCGNTTVTGPTPGSFALGTTVTTFTANNVCNSSSSCTSSVTVVDTTKPTITCPSNLTAECSGNRQATVKTGTAVASDSCSAVVVNDPPDAAYPLGPNNVVHTATDTSQNVASCTQQVTVVDTTPPVMMCPPAVTVECTGNRSAMVTPASVNATDACGPATVTGPGGGSFSIGTTAITLTATDGSNNTTTCTTSITVVDSTPPSIVCPADVTTECTGTGIATGVATGTSMASDTCGTVTVNDPAASDFLLGANVVTHTVTDQANLTASCFNTVTVVDTTPPVFDTGSLGPRDVVGNCGGDPVSFTVPTATDLCQAVTIDCAPLPGNVFGANQATCTATDASGNKTTTNLAVNISMPLRADGTALCKPALQLAGGGFGCSMGGSTDTTSNAAFMLVLLLGGLGLRSRVRRRNARS